MFSTICKSPYLQFLWPFIPASVDGSIIDFSASHVWNLIIDSFALQRRRLWAKLGVKHAQPPNTKTQHFIEASQLEAHFRSGRGIIVKQLQLFAIVWTDSLVIDSHINIYLAWMRVGAWQTLHRLNYPSGWLGWALISTLLYTSCTAAFHCTRQSI